MYRDTGLKVACTQPTIIAAKSLAKVVAHDMGSAERDGFVCCKVRYHDTTNPSASLVFMTNGALLNEPGKGDDLAAYSTVVVEDAHEQSMDTELVLCMIKEVLGSRNSLKLVIMSATLNTNLFLDHFPDSKLIEVKDIEMFNVAIFYLREKPKDIVTAAAELVAEIHVERDPGKVLVFFAGVEEIDGCLSLVFSMVDRRAKDLNRLSNKF